MRLSDINFTTVQSLFDQKLNEIIQNIQDCSTDAEAKRSVTITLEITPSFDRTNCKTNWKVNTKPVPAETSCDTAIMRRENGTYDLESTVGRPEIDGQI